MVEVVERGLFSGRRKHRVCSKRMWIIGVITILGLFEHYQMSFSYSIVVTLLLHVVTPMPANQYVTDWH